MININDNFEDIILKLQEISANPDFIEIQISAPNEFYVYEIYLDDHHESDNYSFTWEISKSFEFQSEETKLIIEQLFFIDPITII